MKNPKLPPPPDNRLIGYARVSTSEQSLDLQVDALKKAGVLDDNLFTEHVSGVSKRRVKLDLAFKDAREGDVFVVWKLDRVGRNLLDLLARMKELEDKKVGFKSLTEGIDTTTPGGRLIMHVMGALSQFERDLIVERTKAGVKAHVERGGKIGQPPKIGPDEEKKIEKLIRKHVRVQDIAKMFKVSTATIYNHFPATRISALRGPRPKK